jgi:hypothetical protein
MKSLKLQGTVGSQYSILLGLRQRFRCKVIIVAINQAYYKYRYYGVMCVSCSSVAYWSLRIILSCCIHRLGACGTDRHHAGSSSFSITVCANIFAFDPSAQRFYCYEISWPKRVISQFLFKNCDPGLADGCLFLSSESLKVFQLGMLEDAVWGTYTLVRSATRSRQWDLRWRRV